MRINADAAVNAQRSDSPSRASTCRRTASSIVADTALLSQLAKPHIRTTQA